MRVILSEGGIRGERRREPGERNRRTTKKGTVELGDGRTDGRTEGRKTFCTKMEWNGGRESGGPD